MADVFEAPSISGSLQVFEQPASQIFESQLESPKDIQVFSQEAQNPKRLEETLSHLVDKLIQKEFKFVTPDVSPQQMHEQVSAFDEKRLALSNQIFGFLVGGADLPDFAKAVTKNIVALGAEDVEDESLSQLQGLMKASFPLCAFGFSQMYGPRFIALLSGDGLTQPRFFEAIDNFQNIDLCMMGIGGRLSFKVLGKSIMGINGSAATGSMIVVASNTECANTIRQWVNSKPLHSDTTLNQLKEMATRWQFWAKAAIGVIEYKPNQLRQEIIVLDAQTGQVTSTASPRLGFEFGFSLEEITCV